MAQVSAHTNTYLEGVYFDNPEDPFKRVYEGIVESIASSIVLYAVVKDLERRLGE